MSEARTLLRQAQNAAPLESQGLQIHDSRYEHSFCRNRRLQGEEGSRQSDETAEDLIKQTQQQPHISAGAAAESLEMHGTAALAYESLYKLEPSNTEYVKSLMGAYIQLGRNDDAIRVGEAVYRKDPTDEEIQVD